MDDLISRQGAIDEIIKHGTNLERRGITVLAVANHTQATVDLLEQMPSAEPEIIRCKDCLMHGVCRFEQGLGLDGYCSQAERRIDDSV